MKVYITGPASADFKAAEAALRAAGIHPSYGPHDITLPAGATPDDVARARLNMMTSCDTVCLLDGWASDRDADFEHAVAKRLGMRCAALCVLLSAPGG